MPINRVLRPEGPWLHPFVATTSDAYDRVWALQKAGETRVVCRTIRGQKARTTQALFDEFAAALQFPYYFGENWDAFDECLTDLEWLPADAYVLLIENSTHLLETETSEQLSAFFQALERAGREWGTPVVGQFPRPAKGFHVLLQCTLEEKSSLHQKLEAAKVSFEPLE
jgi:RNAse (barnase) inhibitor barstar